MSNDIETIIDATKMQLCRHKPCVNQRLENSTKQNMFGEGHSLMRYS